jgi:uncharacterized protein YbaP (TraB family)
VNFKIKRQRGFLLVAFIVGLSIHGIAQQRPVENCLFWEVSGNGLNKPSFLFGTFHLIGKSYLDSLPNVMNRLQQSEAVVGELIIDSAAMTKLMGSMQLQGTTLSLLISPELFSQTSAWLKELSGMDLTMFNNLNPMTVQILLMTLLQQKYFPVDMIKNPFMDTYIQNYGKENEKKVIGLESVDDQIKALYDQFTNERQVEILGDYVSNKENAVKEVLQMNKLYRQQNLSELERLMAAQNYSASETAVMLDNRNKAWIGQLPEIFKKQSAFVAVGALHLCGKNGLVNLLREKGYTVKPLKV